jgi:hypothetical protein
LRTAVFPLIKAVGISRILKDKQRGSERIVCKFEIGFQEQVLKKSPDDRGYYSREDSRLTNSINSNSIDFHED